MIHWTISQKQTKKIILMMKIFLMFTVVFERDSLTFFAAKCPQNVVEGLQTSTDGLTSICTPVHLRSHFYVSNDPSYESVHDKKSVHSSTKMIILVQCPNLSIRWTQILVRRPH